jgi:hypothetical protein
MIRISSNPSLKVESPQYAYALAIMSGGVAFLFTQLGAPRTAWFIYALVASLFGSMWPYKPLRWGFWLCLPIFSLVCFELFTGGGLRGLFSYGTMIVKALSSACFGAYVGSMLSLRKIANHSPRTRAKRKRSAGNGNGARALHPVSKELAAHLSTVETGASIQSPARTVRAQAHVTRFHDLNAELLKAVQASDPLSVRLSIAKGADVNAKSREQWMPLATEAQGGAVEVIRPLFGIAVEPDAPGSEGWTALMIATIAGHVEVVRVLLESGAEVNAEKNSGWTALRFAVSMDETEILRLLLDAGANPNMPDREGTTALMQAASENISESLSMLLAAGADPHLKDHNQRTALTLARKQGHKKIIKLLEEAKAQGAIDADALAGITDDDELRVASPTHRVIRRPRDQYYGLVDRYDVVPLGVPLPSGFEETGREGDEEECRDYALKSDIDEPSELGWWLCFSSQS